MISETALQEFKTLWVSEGFGEITDEEAMELAAKLLSLFDHIYRPVKKKWLDQVSDEEKLNQT
ncbi:MAG: hypothetical protein UT53_C0001G0009 [Candidatus Yanofskybacteria bacterium GW2011_GWD2_39_48]|uniref:Uncharacterized protein n=1 Tax=Candidatus Yanofskybacteria bacterium GW2011_GWD2_39_48 TaxID=1619031 RepID=A0A0G0RNA1_9BACT|nr:MAG: hypothetical protein UT53_C0001G0009 [Candidatus Yanofskybacteria bacterium GW2011_GWD2_39_48]